MAYNLYADPSWYLDTEVLVFVTGSNVAYTLHIYDIPELEDALVKVCKAKMADARAEARAA